MSASVPASGASTAAATTSLADALIGALLRLVMAAIACMPRPCLQLLGRSLAALLPYVARKDARRLRQNVRLVYGLPPQSHFAQMFERQVARHQMLCALETLCIIRDPSLLQLTGAAELRAEVQRAEAPGRGHIIVTAHHGSWELCAYLGHKSASRPFHVLAKPPRRAAFQRFLNDLRERMGVDVFWTDKKSILKDMLSALKRGESVGFVMDQKPEGRKGPVVDFLGQPTEFVSGPAAMAIRTGCAIVSIFCVREGPFRYRAVGRMLAPADHGETDELALTQRLAAEIEAVIRLYPEQWTWSYKRWRDV